MKSLYIFAIIGLWVSPALSKKAAKKGSKAKPCFEAPEDCTYRSPGTYEIYCKQDEKEVCLNNDLLPPSFTPEAREEKTNSRGRFSQKKKRNFEKKPKGHMHQDIGYIQMELSTQHLSFQRMGF